jgi:uncharacterized beta-barrel protein YwiB (DUF1934 family)
MPRYYFDLQDGEEVSIDAEGSEMADMHTVRDEATMTLMEMARDRFPLRGEARTLSIRVRDGGGKHLLAISVVYSEEPPDWVR